MWQPSVSVVMCTYNGAVFLEQQMASILAQTYPVDEILIFDDASSDNTLGIAGHFASTNPQIHIFKNKQTLGFNRNFAKALQAANGEVIAIADQDDYWLPEKLEKMIGAWNREMPVIHCDTQRFSGSMPQTKKLQPKLNRFRGTCTRQLFLFNSVSGHALLLQRSFLQKILPFEKDIYYDWWAAVVASCNGGVDYLNETLVLQRLHEDNASCGKLESRKKQFIQYRQLVAAHLKKFVTAPNISPQDKTLAESVFRNIDSLETNAASRLRLFLLLIRHRNAFFYQKKRAVSVFSHYKYAWEWAFR